SRRSGALPFDNIAVDRRERAPLMPASPTDEGEPMFCATVLYPNSEGGTFDFGYYAKTLAPMYAEFLGDNCVRFEAGNGLTTPGAPMAAFACVASYWVRSDKEYGESLGDPRFPEIMAKFAAFTDVEPIRQFDEVIAGSYVGGR